MPGIEMSGGYGLFQPGGRLPAHVHDFDESICIIEGEATCVVEGRRYTMCDGATALAAARAGPLLHQRLGRADGHDLGLRRARRPSGSSSTSGARPSRATPGATGTR